MSIIDDTIIGAAGKVIEAVGNAADSLFTSDDERNKAEIEMRRIDGDVEKAYLDDTDSARKMQGEALRQDDIFAKRFIYWFAIGWSAFSMVFFLGTTFMDIPEQNIRVVDTILGFLLGTAIASIFNFFLGTSLQSRSKDATISNLSRER